MIPGTTHNVLGCLWFLFKIQFKIELKREIYIIIRIHQKYPMALLKEYLELTKKYLREYGEKTVVLMQVGDNLKRNGFGN